MFADFHMMGNLTQFPDYRAYAQDKFLCNISIAVNRTKGADADYYNLTAFGEKADYIHKYATKGQRIYVEGYMSQKVYEKDGKKQRATSRISTTRTARVIINIFSIISAPISLGIALF